MQTQSSESSSLLKRLGVHYFPDTFHYRDIDLTTWLPELSDMGAGWIVLQSDVERAIPESFITGLCSAGIQPIVRFHLPLSLPVSTQGMRTLLEAYSRWGVKYVVFFDRPNSRSAWPSSGWAKQDLVERFLDRFLPLANLALEVGLTPVLPPLEPGGSFWDTAFLWTVLQSLERRKQQALIDHLVLSAYAWTQHHSLNWGKGGPQRWPEVRPYFTPPGDQDQRGFRIYEWYQAIGQAVLQKKLPVILFQAGLPTDPEMNSSRIGAEYGDTCLTIVRILQGENLLDPSYSDEALDPIGNEVLACNFWLLSTEAGSKYAGQAWYTEKDQPQPFVQQIKDVVNNFQRAADHSPIGHSFPMGRSSHLIQHYVLLPTYSWGMADWHWNIIQPYVRKHRPTVGFSLEEAALAEEVIVLGNDETVSEEELNWLRQLGCRVDRINGDGTSIATQLGER